MCRRADYDEIKLLGNILSEKLRPAKEAGSVMDQLRKATGRQDLRLDFRVRAETKDAMAQAERALPGTAADWLDMLCRGRSWTWYVWGDDIVILDKKAQYDRQLQRQVALNYRSEELVKVLLDLARKARVKLAMDPGALNYLPAETLESFSLRTNATIAEALEVISGVTGLQFVPTDEGLRVEASEELKLRSQPTTRPRRKTPFFVRLTVPGPGGAKIDVFFRADELPDDVVKSFEDRRAELIEALRGMQGGAETRPAAGGR